MAIPRMCGLADNIQGASAAGDLCRWTKSELTYRFDNDWPMLPKADVARAFKIAFDQWAAVCNLRFKLVTGSSADISIYSRPMDGPSRVLAEAELQCPPGNRALWTRFDNTEPFVVAVNPPQSKVSLIAVACHEIGHLLGIGHLPMNSGALMAPMYDPRISKPQTGDIAEAVARYGLAVPEPGAPPQPPTGAGEFVMMKFPKDWLVVPEDQQ